MPAPPRSSSADVNTREAGEARGRFSICYIRKERKKKKKRVDLKEKMKKKNAISPIRTSHWQVRKGTRIFVRPEERGRQPGLGEGESSAQRKRRKKKKKARRYTYSLRSEEGGPAVVLPTFGRKRKKRRKGRRESSPRVERGGKKGEPTACST